MFLPEMLEIIQNKRECAKEFAAERSPVFLFRLMKRFVSEQSPDKINGGDRHPFSESVGPPDPEAPSDPGDADGALAPDPGANVPQAEKASRHLTQPGCSQPSQLPPALWLRAG